MDETESALALNAQIDPLSRLHPSIPPFIMLIEQSHYSFSSRRQKANVQTIASMPFNRIIFGSGLGKMDQIGGLARPFPRFSF